MGFFQGKPVREGADQNRTGACAVSGNPFARHVGNVLLTILAAFVFYLAIAGEGKAQGEYRREVPAWWAGAALCVHNHEGSWQANTGNGFYGGLQMDLSFQRTYGGWMLEHYGTADHWSPRAQLIIAHRGWLKRGWWPWPNTARMCGLL